MTQTSTADEIDDELWRAIDGLALDDPVLDLTFSQRLARENRWQHWYALRVIDEYKRFLYLLGRAGHPVTPCYPVDQAWHLHLLYSRSYWEELAPHYASPPHHGPTKGGGAEGEKFRDWYQKTLESYARLFGEDPPGHIWETVEERFRPDRRWVWADVGTYLLFPRRKFTIWAAALIGSLAINVALLGVIISLLR